MESLATRAWGTKMTHAMRRLMEAVQPLGETIQRIHVAKRPLGHRLERVSYPQRIGRKPNGFWWAIGTSWMDFARSSGTQGARARSTGVPYQVMITDTTTIVRLTEWDSILAFTIAYGCTYAPKGVFFWQTGDQTQYDPRQDEQLARTNHCRVPAIRWDRVALDYDGIELPEYRRPHGERPSIEWLDNDWDVAGGCAWRLEGIGIEPLKLD